MQSYAFIHNTALRTPAHRLSAPRGPAPTRTRSRWQPYNSSIGFSAALPPSKSSPVPYLNTPPSSVTSTSTTSPQQTPYVTDSIRPVPSQVSSRDLGARGGNKSRSILDLVDTAANVLCNIWRPKTIPSKYRSPSLADSAGATHESRSVLLEENNNVKSHSNIQLPSPISPNTEAPLSVSPSLPPLTPDKKPSVDDLIDDDTHGIQIRGFIREVLRRSKTSGFVLQTALCYLEAVRPKIDQALNDPSNAGLFTEPNHEDFILKSSSIAPGTLEDVSTDILSTVQDCNAVMDTVRISEPLPDISMDPDLSFDEASMAAYSGPSPLLCPRRSFLAALILASKFLQDKCYSNRAWAKLSGLPPREIGRCERALGAALEWRLWVGKSGSTSSTSSSTISSSTRSLGRSRSESSIVNFGPTPPTEGCHSQMLSGQSTRSLLRSASLPSDSFAFSSCQEPRNDNACYDVSHCSTIQEVPLGSLDMDTDVYDHRISGATCQPHQAVCGRDGFSAESPTPQTPGLTYSPSSSSSSSGGCTVQMSSFLDDPTLATPGYSGIMSETSALLDYKDACVNARLKLSLSDAHSSAAHGPNATLTNCISLLEMADDRNGISHPSAGLLVPMDGIYDGLTANPAREQPTFMKSKPPLEATGVEYSHDSLLYSATPTWSLAVE